MRSRSRSAAAFWPERRVPRLVWRSSGRSRRQPLVRPIRQACPLSGGVAGVEGSYAQKTNAVWLVDEAGKPDAAARESEAACPAAAEGLARPRQDESGARRRAVRARSRQSTTTEEGYSASGPSSTTSANSSRQSSAFAEHLDAALTRARRAGLE